MRLFRPKLCLIPLMVFVFVMDTSTQESSYSGFSLFGNTSLFASPKPDVSHSLGNVSTSAEKSSFRSYGHDSHGGGGGGGYGHDSHGGGGGGYGHDDHGHGGGGGYGHDDHGGGHGHDDHGGGGYGGSSHGRKASAFGKATPNFKCEKVDKTLYVTKTNTKYKDDCYNVYKTKCKTVYDSGKDIGYKTECDEFSVTRCRTVYDTDIKKKCSTFYTKKCSKFYETISDWVYEQKCNTFYEEQCSGYGYHKHCESHPKEKCKQIPRQVKKHVPKTKCTKVPKKKCNEFPVHVPKKECKDFPKKICTQVPVQVKKDITKKVCKSIPKKVCNSIPVTIIDHIPKTVWFKKCHSTKSGGYGHGHGMDHYDGFGRNNEDGALLPEEETQKPDIVSVNKVNAESPSSEVAKPPLEALSYIPTTVSPPVHYSSPVAPVTLSPASNYFTKKPIFSVFSPGFRKSNN